VDLRRLLSKGRVIAPEGLRLCKRLLKRCAETRRFCYNPSVEGVWREPRADDIDL